MKARLRGKVWHVRYVKRMPNTPDGECDAPDIPGKEIRIREGQQGRELVDTVIHEALHACFWDLDDEAVHEAGHDIARLLDRLGLLR